MVVDVDDRRGRLLLASGVGELASASENLEEFNDRSDFREPRQLGPAQARTD
jgi:hypothetical protein